MSSEDELSTPTQSVVAGDDNNNNKNNNGNDDAVPSWLLAALNKPLPPPPERPVAQPSGETTADRVAVVSKNYSRSLPPEYHAARLDVEEDFAEIFEALEDDEATARFDLHQLFKIHSWQQQEGASGILRADTLSPSVAATNVPPPRSSVCSCSSNASPEMQQDREELELLLANNSTAVAVQDYQKITAACGDATYDWNSHFAAKFEQQRAELAARYELSPEKILQLEAKLLLELQESVERSASRRRHLQQQQQQQQQQYVSGSPSPAWCQRSLARTDLDSHLSPSQRAVVLARREEQWYSLSSAPRMLEAAADHQLAICDGPGSRSSNNNNDDDGDVVKKQKRRENPMNKLPPGFLFGDKLAAVSRGCGRGAAQEDESGMMPAAVSQDTSEIFHEARQASQVASFCEEMKIAEASAHKALLRAVELERKRSLERMMQEAAAAASVAQSGGADVESPNLLYQKAAFRKDIKSGGWSDDVTSPSGGGFGAQQRTSALVNDKQRVPRLPSPGRSTAAQCRPPPHQADDDSVTSKLSLPSEWKKLQQEEGSC